MEPTLDSKFGQMKRPDAEERRDQFKSDQGSEYSTSKLGRETRNHKRVLLTNKQHAFNSAS